MDPGARGVGKLGDGPFANQLSPADDHDSVDGLLNLSEQVAGDQNRAALIMGEVPQEVTQPLDAFGVKAVGGLVEDEHLRVAQQRGGQAEPLAHPKGVTAGLSLCRVRHPDLGQDRIGTFIGRPLGRAINA